MGFKNTQEEPAHDPSAPQPVVHARIQRAGAGKSAQFAGRRHHPRPRGFGGAGRQGARPRPDRQGGRRKRLWQARGADPGQQPGYAVVGRGRHHGRQGPARRHPGSQDFQRHGPQHHRRPAQRHQRGRLDQGLGDDRDRTRGAGRGSIGRRGQGLRRRDWRASCSGRTTFRGRRGSACSRAALR